MEFEIKDEPKHVKKESLETTINDEIQSKIIKPKSIIVTNLYEPKMIINKAKKVQIRYPQVWLTLDQNPNGIGWHNPLHLQRALSEIAMAMLRDL